MDKRFSKEHHDLSGPPGKSSTLDTKRLRRVLFLVNLDPSLKFGSLEEQTLSLARAFRDRNSLFLPAFICPMKEKEQSSYDTAGLPVSYLDLRSFSVAKLSHLLRLMNENRIDIVHWNFYHSINLYAGLLKLLKPGIDQYMTDHISRPSTGSEPTGLAKAVLKRLFVHLYSKVFCVSDFILADLLSHGTWPNLFRYHHFINTTRFRPDHSVKTRIRNNLTATNSFVLLIVAYLIPEKGVDLAIRALSLLPPYVDLWIVGDGPHRAMLQTMTKDLSLDKRVTFLGLQHDVVPYMQAADCFLCPSLWGEAAGLVILEALGCGLPVIASRIGGIPEFIDDGTTGFLFPPGDHSALAEMVRRLLGTPELARSMGERARSTAQFRFSDQHRLPELLSAYETV